jgi:hypothetical protein
MPALVAVGLLAATAACDSGATGIEACRSIETARCHAVVRCPGSPVTSEEDASNCELFYRDHCLHGMADGLNPDQGTVDSCVVAIGLARACQDSGQTLAACNAAALDGGTEGPTLIASASPGTTGCQAVLNPELLQACNFLAVAPTAPGTGGTGATAAGGGGGDVGGAGGAGG